MRPLGRHERSRPYCNPSTRALVRQATARFCEAHPPSEKGSMDAGDLDNSDDEYTMKGFAQAAENAAQDPLPEASPARQPQRAAQPAAVLRHPGNARVACPRRGPDSWPAARETAFATAASGGTIGTSPTPRTP